MRAGIYVRLSSDPDGTSTATERQAQDARAYADARSWRAVSLYRDNDLSAFKRSVVRPEFERLLDDVRGGKLDVVIVWKSDRLARQPRDLERFLDAAEGRSVALVSLTEPFDASNGMGLFMLRQMVAFANYESSVKADRVARKRREKAEHGTYGGGRRPFGYRVADGGGLVIDEAEAVLIRDSYDLIRAGSSLGSIVRLWLERAPERAWAATTVKRVLLAPRIAGLYVHHGEVVGAASWPRIVTPEEQEEIKRYFRHEPRGRGAGRVEARYLLSGFIRCGVCSARMFGRRRPDRKHSDAVYRCLQNHAAIACGIADEKVSGLVLAVMMKPELLAQLADVEETDESATIVEELRAAEERLTSLAEDYGAGLVTRSEFLAAREKASEAAERARSALARLSVPIDLPTPETALQAWNEADLGQRRAWLSYFVEEVRIVPGRGPDRVSLVWRL